jgi:adenylate cyclase
VLILLGTAECLAHNIDDAAVHVSQGLALDPNSAWGWNRNGYIHTYRGQPERAIEYFNRSQRLSPFDPMSHSTYFGIAGANFVAEKYDEALSWIDKAIACRPEMTWVHRLSAACAAMTGDRVRAVRAVKQIRSFAPGIGATQLTDAVPWQVPKIRERYRIALIEAGFPA